MKKEFREYLAKLGAKGGKAAAQKMTAAQRSERARKAVAAREARKGEK
jgi:hypothetical protein